jgi:rhodanese-related sulfurtransferase
MVQRWTITVALGLLACFSGVSQAQIFRSGPEIKEISTKDLVQMLNKRTQQEHAVKENRSASAKEEFIVVDVRDPQEYRVSMIPGAITRAQYDCTVGGRSLQYSKQLASKGVKVLNFKESIIGWCNSKLPLVTPDGKATNQVHTYSARNKVPADYTPVY